MANPLIKFIPGINPEPDETKQNTRHLIDGNHVRFFRDGVEKIGGHAQEVKVFFDVNGNALTQTEYEGCLRSHFSYFIAGNRIQMIGTNSKLYAKNGAAVWNMTPLKTTATTTLGTDPLALVSGDKTMTVTYTAHGQAVGDRIRLAGATHGTVGFADTNINVEHIIATVPDANTFTVEIANNAPATDATEGGAAVEIFTEIDDGECDAVAASGPGVGTVGTGLPGAIGTDPTNYIQPRIWWFDMFGTTLVCGPGDSGKAYSWSSLVTTAPAVITNAPDANIGWIENAKLVIFDGNILYNSNVGSLTDWTPAAGSSAYEDTKEDARNIIARAYANGENLIFDEDARVFRLRWVGGSVKWQWERMDYQIAIMAPNAHFSRGGVIYVFAKDNVYAYNAGIFQPIPGNTLAKYLYQSINVEQRFKSFVWFNAKPFYELHIHYPSAGSNEPDRVVILGLQEPWWSKREGLERTAADRGNALDYPVLCSSDNTYQHEVGYDDDGAAMNAFVQVAYEAIGGGTVYSEITGMEPDLILTGNATVELYGKDRSMEDGVLLQSFTVDNDSTKLDCDEEARWRSWLLRSNEIGGFFRWGGMREFAKPGSEF